MKPTQARSTNVALIQPPAAEVEDMTAVIALRRKACGCVTAVFTNEQLARSMKAAFPRKYRIARLPPAKAFVVQFRHNVNQQRRQSE